MTPHQIVDALMQKNRDLQEMNKALKDANNEYAELEHLHVVMFEALLVRLRKDGAPVGLVRDVVKGTPEVSLAKKRMAVAEATVQERKNEIVNIRYAIDTLRSMLALARTEYEAADLST